MTLQLYMDHHVKSAVTRELRRRDVDVLTAAEDGAEEFDDIILLARATDLGRVLVSQDDDMTRIAANWQADGRFFRGVIYGHEMRVTIGQVIKDLELIVKVYEAEEMENRVEFLPL